MRERGLRVGALVAVAVIAGCSSGAGSTTSSPPAATVTPAVPTSSAAPSMPSATVSAPLSPDAAVAKQWLETAPHRLDVELMVARAAAVRRSESGSACSQLVSAAFALDDEFPLYRSVGSRDALIQNLEDAASKYTLAGNACGIGHLTQRYIASGDALIKAAERRGRELGTQI